jgi:hypothetical protein
MGIRDLIKSSFQHLNSLFIPSASYLLNSSDPTIGIANTWTIAMWIKGGLASSNADYLHLKNSATANDQIVISRISTTGTLSIALSNSGGTTFKNYVWGTAAVPGNPAQAGPWMLYCFTWDGTTLNCYINGALVAPTTKTTDNAGTMATTGRSISLGASITGTLPCGSTWHSLGIWSSVLTAAEAAAMASGNVNFDWRTLQGSNLQHYYLFGREGNKVKEFGVGTPIDLTANAVGPGNMVIGSQIPATQVQGPGLFKGHRNCIDFDATVYLQATNASVLFMNVANNWTVMQWLKLTEVPAVIRTYYTLRSSANIIACTLLGGNAGKPLRFAIANTAGTQFKVYDLNNPFTQNVWAQVIYSWDGTNLNCYFNGVNQTMTKTTDNAGSMTNGAGGMTIGAGNGGGSPGKFRCHSLAAWGSAINSADALALYNNGIGWNFDLYNLPAQGFTSISSPVHWWLLGDPSPVHPISQIVYDRITSTDPFNNPYIDFMDNNGGGVGNVSTANCISDDAPGL